MHDVRLALQRLGVNHSIYWQKEILQITNEYECHFLFSLIVSTYNFQTKVMWALEFLAPHPIVLNPQYTLMNFSQRTNLYDLMEINEKMTSLVVKKTTKLFQGQKSY